MISIIVPVYNSGFTLEKCIESILKQTYANWELLLINDGSKDNSGAICEAYSQKDERIKVFHKENGGVSSARNMGLHNANGEWVTFVDSDDWVKESYLSNLLYHVDDNIDLVFSYSEIHTKNSFIKEKYSSKVVTLDNLYIAFLENDLHWHTSPWSKLFKMSIILKYNISFDEKLMLGEDLFFLYSYMLKTNSIYISSDTDYCYMYDSFNSLTKRFFTIESEIYLYKRINFIIDQMSYIVNKNNNLAIDKFHEMKGKYVRRFLNALYHTSMIHKTVKERIAMMKEVDLNEYIHYFNPDSYKEIFLQCLLRRDYLLIYDLIRKYIVNIKLLVRLQ
ncbi:glycosyltransferase family A protein [uncultured Bacteroides sp.]|uniref:glycosyltransferase family 2 protein n=1 Tax=uncultured Bacteroides sp. TaxID=162156 RepID=UPI002636C30D|nr:glycosyltransferase family A protein [uncultured Bacteroides sp.]